jgi:hypothetical protein
MQNPEPIKFMYSTAAYDSYIKEGFTPPLEYQRPDFKERDLVLLQSKKQQDTR